MMISEKFTHAFNYMMVLLLILLMNHCNNPQKEDIPQEPVSKKSTQREKPELVYDTKGNIIERHAKNYRSDNTVRSVETYYYKYDDRNNLIEETKESSNPDGKPVYKNINYYVYNELNQKIEQRFESFNNNNQLQQQARNTYRYNKKGELREEISYYENGAVKSIINTLRNDDGEIKSEEYIQMNKDGVKTDHKIYHYSKYGLERTEDLIIK